MEPASNISGFGFLRSSLRRSDVGGRWRLSGSVVRCPAGSPITRHAFRHLAPFVLTHALAAAAALGDHHFVFWRNFKQLLQRFDSGIEAVFLFLKFANRFTQVHYFHPNARRVPS